MPGSIRARHKPSGRALLSPRGHRWWWLSALRARGSVQPTLTACWSLCESAGACGRRGRLSARSLAPADAIPAGRPSGGGVAAGCAAGCAAGDFTGHSGCHSNSTRCFHTAGAACCAPPPCWRVPPSLAITTCSCACGCVLPSSRHCTPLHPCHPHHPAACCCNLQRLCRSCNLVSWRAPRRRTALC